MADYAASVRVNTKIETDKAKSQLLSLENRLQKTTDKIEDLNRKMKDLENQKTPTKEYEALQKQLSQADGELTKLIDKLNNFENLGFKSGSAWENLNDEIATAGIRVDDIKEDMEQLVSEGKAFTLGSDTEQYFKLSRQLKYAENDLSALEQKHKEAVGKMSADEQAFGQKSVSTFGKIRQTAQSAFGKIGTALQGAFRGAGNLINKMGETAKRVFRRMHSDTQKQNSLLSTLKSRLGGIALSLMVFNWITRGFNAALAGMKEGLQNMALYSGEYNNAVSGLVSSLATLKNAFASAFEPILTIAIPYLTQLISYINTAVNAVAQFIAVLVGKTSWTKAKKQTIDYAQGLTNVSNAAKEAYHSLAAFDELNVLDKSDTSSSAGSGAGAVNPDDLFEEVPIDSKIKELADKFKDVLSQIFAPLKKAWDRQGKKVMDAWKYALDEVYKLVKSIGKDFLEVWNQEATVKIFEDILLILADIGLVIGNLARQFRKAWEENETGKRILENIRDLIGIIVSNIKDAADFTVDWSDTLDFSPLLEAFERFTESLAPAIDFLSGVLTDFYTHVLLPLAGWTIQEGLPDFLDILTKFNQTVKWDELRARLADFWDRLEPFAETIGEGLLLFIENLSQKLAGFMNSQAFSDFLTTVEDWMSKVTPQDVADGLMLICDAILAYKAISVVTSMLSTVTSFISFFTGGTVTESVAGMGSIATGIGYLCTALSGLLAFQAIKNPFIDLMAATDSTGQDAEKKAETLKEKYSGLTGTFQAVGDFASAMGQKIDSVFTDMPTYIDGLTPSWQVLEEALDKVSEGTIYTDEQFQKMQNTMGLSEEDIETLRQATLDANSDLRTLADSSEELWGATPQTLADVNEGLSMIDSGLVTNQETLHEYGDAIGFTEEALAYLEERLASTAEAAEQTQEDMNSAGKNAAEGFAQGFEEGAVEIDTKTDSFLGNLINSIRTKLGIHSPSTVLAEIGRYLIEGLISGVDSMQGRLVQVLNSLCSMVSNIFSKMASFVSNAVSSIFSKVSSIGSSVSTAWNNLTSGSKLSRSYAVAYQEPEVALAGGGVTTGTTIAKIGEAGREAVLPLENNTDWMDALADRINGSGEITIVAELDGDAIFKKTIKKNEIYKKQNGRSAYA